MKHSRRAVLAGSLLAGVVVASGCSAGGGDATPDGPVELEYLGWVTGLQDSIDIWNEQNPDVQVTLRTTTGSAEAYPAIRSGVQAGNAPCLAQMSYDTLPSFVADDLLLPITEYASQYEDLFLNWTWANVTAGGEVFGIPQDTGPMVLYYNDAKFEEFGITVPTTWEEYAAAAAAVKAQDPGVTLGFIGSDDVGNYAGLVAQNGGNWTAIDGDEWVVGVNDPQALEVAEFWQGLVERQEVTITPRFDAGIYPQFNDGKILSMIGASWNYLSLTLNLPDQEGQWRVAQMPKWGGSESTANHGGSASVVLKGCDYPEQATEFANWLNSAEESMDILVGDGGLYPAATAALEYPILKDGVDFYGGQVIFDEFAESAQNADSSWTFGPTYVGTSTAYADGFSAVAAGERTLMEVADTVQEVTLTEMQDRGIAARSWE